MPKKKEGTSAKKATPKKSKKKVSTPKVASPQHAFVTLDGKRLHTILELAHELDTMADHVFYHHVSPQRNDFSNWIRDIFDEAELARQIAATQDKHHTHIIVLRHVVNELPTDN